MNENYFEELNKALLGKECSILGKKYWFMCFYMGERVPMVMLKEQETYRVVILLLSNSLELAF